MNEEVNKKIKSILSKDKTRNLLIVACVVLALLLLLYSGCTKEKAQSTDLAQAGDTENYRNALSQEIKNMVESVKGVGEAKVLLTLDTSYEYIYLDDDETLRKVIEPQIRGVVITCEGGDSAKVRQDITDLLTTALGISSTKVCVNKLS